MSKHVALLMFLLITSIMCMGQKRVLDIPASEVSKKERITLTDSASTAAFLQNHYAKWLALGYLDAQLDTLCSDTICSLQVHPGERYELGSIQWLQNTSGEVIDEIRWRHGVPMNAAVFLKQAEEKVVYYENHGHPFAAIQVQKIERDSIGRYHVFAGIDPGPIIRMDSLIITSKSKMPQRYIRGYIRLSEQELYDESKLNQVRARLQELPFLTQTKASEVRFGANKYQLRLFLERKKANYFNGILGLRPDDATGKINITGDLELKLLNALNTGEEFYFNWRKLQPQTQDLQMRLALPYLFSTPIGVDGDLKIYRRDSTFSSVKGAFGLLFNLGGSDYLKVFVERNQSSQLSQVLTAGNIGNINNTLYGLQFRKERLDYRYNPRQGYSATVQLATGTRQLRNNAELINLENRSIYRAEWQGEYFIPLFKQQAIRVANAGAWMQAPGLYDNEVFRIGGLRTIRGFNEESIFASAWSVWSVEYRLIFEKNSAVYLFADQSWYEKQGITQFITDTPYGFGAGVNFETGAGIFTFNYALGAQFDQPILFRNARVSFGFRNVF